MKGVTLSLCLVVIFGCSKRTSGPAPSSAVDSTQAGGESGGAMALPVLTYEQRQGKYLYGRYCAVCHGDQGAGDGFNAYNLNPKPHSLADSSYMAALSDASLKQVVELGGRSVNRSVLMPAYGGTLGQDEISYLVAYMRMFAQKPGTTE